MNFRQLSYIVTIFEEQNISRAAERLFISRPALNHYLINLENELGTPLFKRIRKKLIPTYAGNVYIDAAKQILEIRKRAYKKIADTSDDAEGSLGLGVTREVGIGLLKEVFPIFNRKYPNFRLDLIEGNARELEHAVENGRVDLAVIGCHDVRGTLEHIPFFRSEVVIILPPGHRLSVVTVPSGEARESLDLRLLAEDKFILINRDTNIRDLCDRHLARAGLTPDILMECSLMSMAYSMVKQGVGVSILMEQYVNPGDGVSCFSLRPKEIWSQGIVFRKGTVFTKVEQCFIELAREYFVRNANDGSMFAIMRDL